MYIYIEILLYNIFNRSVLQNIFLQYKLLLTTYTLILQKPIVRSHHFDLKLNSSVFHPADEMSIYNVLPQNIQQNK